MKNVAGFDVSRMITGSLGTLGVIVEVSLKCLPIPGLEATHEYELAAEEAIRKCNEWGGRPLPISATCWHAGRLRVRFSGARPAVEAALQRLGGAPVDDAAPFWRSVRDQTHPFFAQTGARDTALWRLSVRSTAPDRAHDGDQMIEWGGALRWLFASEANADSMRGWAQRSGGHATVFRSRHRTIGAFHPLAPAMNVLHRRLKAVFDPMGILNPGRMYPDF
jgi:glycolate oxidase FAD binding subunit